MSKKAKAFDLFDQGLRPGDPELKALGIAAKTRFNYFQLWKRLPSEAAQKIAEVTKVGKESGTRGLATILPGGEWIAPISEVAMKSTTDGGAINGETEKGESSNVSPLAEIIHGFGLTVTVEISVKTLMLYQIAAARVDEPITLGEFFDDCVEDFYRGRGVDLGLIRIGGK